MRLGNGQDGLISPLPTPRWGTHLPTLNLSEDQYEDLATRADTQLRQLLESENYDSVHNFITLHSIFEDEKGLMSLREVFKKYSPLIRPYQHTCVGLAFELVKRFRELEENFPGLKSAVVVLSCEESVMAVKQYVCAGEGPESVSTPDKEHVVVGVKISLDGRPGLLLADPGYHIPRLITVMQDCAYPHTGWFTQRDETLCCKEYHYMFNKINTNYVEWHEKETRGLVIKQQTSLIYAGKPYLSAIEVTEKRNLVHNFRSLLARNQKGHVVAGIYFPVNEVNKDNKDAQFTIFFEDSRYGIQKIKYKFSHFLEPENIPECMLYEIKLCNFQLRYDEGELKTIICRLAKVMSNASFINQLLTINNDICRLGIN